MKIPLLSALLFGCTCIGFVQAGEPAPTDPNYTGPSAPTEDLPDMDLPADKPFSHPGILHSQADLDFVRARLTVKEEPWTGALAAMRASEYCQPGYKPRIIPVINPHDNSVGYLMKDASAAYGHALLWCLTGERAHADKAIEILDASGTLLKSIEPGRNDQGKVTAGFTGCKFASAAELIAHYRQPDGSIAGWPQESADRFRQMLLTVFYPCIENFKPEFNGNWDACMAATMMSLGVFCDDHAKFNRALDYYLHGEGHGSITHYIHSHGQNQESGRDQIHAQMGLGSLAASCEIAKKQGIDLYAAAGNRLAAGYEHMAKYLAGHDVDIVGDVPISPHGRDRFMPVFELAYQHYIMEKKLDLPFLREAAENHRPEDVDLIVLQSWGTLTNYRGPATPASSGWKLVWSDDFDKPGTPDSSKWMYETGMLRNNEAQLYTADRPENVRVEDGVLVIEARKEAMAVPGKAGKTAAYTSGSLHSRGKADWLYGRIEVRAKLPKGRGMWPAIWMMPTDNAGGWPACGEIDIMEYVGYEPETIHGTVHTAAYNHVKRTQKGSKSKTPGLEEDFHVYAIEWDAQTIRFYFDGGLYFTFSNDGKGTSTWPFGKAFYLKLNSAVGGGWGGRQGIDDSIFPQKFLVDYVRVYQKTDKQTGLRENP